MKYPSLNTFAAWFFIPQTVGMAWVAGGGTLLLSAFSLPAHEGDVPSRMVGALLMLLVVFVAWYLLRGLPPKGRPEGNGYAFGHKLVLAANAMAACLFVFQFFEAGIDSHNLHLVLEKFTSAFGYMAMGCFAIGFSFIYQSSLPQEEKGS